MGADLVFGPMEVEHLDQVLSIENHFPGPWSKKTFVDEITDNPYASYVVAQVATEVVGFGGIWLLLDEAHITNIAVAPQWQRRGVATGLMDCLLQRGWHLGATKFTLEVRRSNVAAQQLYRRFDFVEAGVRRGYYTDDGEDAIIMWLNSVAEYLMEKEEANG